MSSISITLTENDLKRLGSKVEENFWYDNDDMSESDRRIFEGGTCFLLGDTSNIEYIMLRSILTHLGYRLTEGEDFFIYNFNKCCMLVKTTYPWKKYRELK